MVITEIEGAPGYMVSDAGYVIYPSGVWTLGRPDPKGYMRAEIRYTTGCKTVKVHKLVAQAFCKKLSNHTEINHKDSDKSNNAATNLEWCTHQENMDHYYAEGNVVTLSGESHGRSKLTMNDVVNIKDLIAKGERSRDIAKLYPVTEQMIYRIKKGLAWSEV